MRFEKSLIIGAILIYDFNFNLFRMQAVMKMCDILHARHVKVHLRFDPIFNMTKTKERQEKLLDTIHGLTKRVIKEKKRLFEQNYKEGSVPTPSLSEIIANDYVVPSKPAKKADGLRDDLDDIDENDVGEYSENLICKHEELTTKPKTTINLKF